MTASATTASPESIALLRLSALGDVCHCVGLVRSLQRAFPQSEITWIIGKNEHRLVERLEGVDFIVLDKKAGRVGRKAVRRRLRGRRFEVLLHAQVSARANWLSLFIRAKRKIGFDRARSREGHGLVINERIRAVPQQHQAEALLEFARALGANTDGIDRAPPIADADREFARKHQPEKGRAVLISPCSSHPQRNWSADRYAAVADHVAHRHGRPVILVGGPSRIEREMADGIVALAEHRVTNLVGKDTLCQALAMLERSACLIAPDSGPVHFASALGTPVVGLYAATWSKRSGPLGSLEHCVDRFPEAAQRFLGKAPDDLDWGKRIEREGVMDLVGVEDVERIDVLLG